MMQLQCQPRTTNKYSEYRKKRKYKNTYLKKKRKSVYQAKGYFPDLLAGLDKGSG